MPDTESTTDREAAIRRKVMVGVFMSMTLLVVVAFGGWILSSSTLSSDESPRAVTIAPAVTIALEDARALLAERWAWEGDASSRLRKNSTFEAGVR